MYISTPLLPGKYTSVLLVKTRCLDGALAGVGTERMRIFGMPYKSMDGVALRTKFYSLIFLAKRHVL